MQFLDNQLEIDCKHTPLYTQLHFSLKDAVAVAYSLLVQPSIIGLVGGQRSHANCRVKTEGKLGAAVRYIAEMLWQAGGHAPSYASSEGSSCNALARQVAMPPATLHQRVLGLASCDALAR